MAKKNRASIDNIIDCACVIHSTAYDWQYVDKLYNMLSRHMPQGIRLHVYTESSRPVPSPMIKHELKAWPGIEGAKRSWWYKIQLFNPAYYSGNLLYFDLDCVVVNDLSWIPLLDTDCFWTIRDFRYLQRQSYSGMNSSIMWWNVSKFAHIWNDFDQLDINRVVIQYPGDQDYLGAAIPPTQRRFFDQKHIQSWRWQVRDGGYDFTTRRSKRPGGGSADFVGNDTSVLVFHGRPKPHECTADPVIANNWC